MRLKIKNVMDVILIILFIMMMGYHIFEADIHEYLGLVILCIVIFHHGLNIRYYQYLKVGKYYFLRWAYLVLNILLFLCLIAVMVSGFMLSKNFSFLGLHGGMVARKIHLLSSAWMFIIMAFHIGFHTNKLKQWGKRLLPECKQVSFIIKVGIMFISLYGLYAVYKRNLISDMFLLVDYKFLPFGESIFLFAMDYISIMITFASIGYRVTKLHKKTQ